MVECLNETTATCSTNPGGSDENSSEGPKPEICDGKDNDCDGTVDDGGDALCTNNSISQVATCLYDPDGIDFTWDWFPGFGSVCQGSAGCTVYDGSDPWTLDINHTCNVSECGAECESDEGCASGACLADSCECNRSAISGSGDVNADCEVGLMDLVMVGYAYGSVTGSPYWKADADVNSDKVIDILDLGIVGLHYGEKC